jgi:hypothetical protein
MAARRVHHKFVKATGINKEAKADNNFSINQLWRLAAAAANL